MDIVRPYSFNSLTIKILFPAIVFIVILLPILSLVSIYLGYENFNLRYFLYAITSQQLDQLPVSILHNLAIPRALMAIFAGIGMSVAGCLLQQALQNDFASPATLGVNVGAMVAVLVCGVVAADLLTQWAMLIAFIGAASTGTLVYTLARAISPAPINLILVGMAVSLALGAVSAGMLMMFEGRLDGFYIWGAGNLGQANVNKILSVGPLIGILSMVSFFLARKLDFFTLGDNTAVSLGISVGRLRIAGVALAMLISAIVVSGVGIISFIGLVAPHIARGLGAKTMVKRLFLSSIIGIILLLFADTVSLMLARIDYLIPAGALTTLLGAPFMMYLLRNTQRQPGQQKEQYDVGISTLFTCSTHKALFVLSLFLVIAIVISLSNDTPINIGLPRLLVSALAGMGLAVSGLILQTMLRNPLASPDVIGITSGGIFAVVLASTFFSLERAGMIMVSLLSTIIIVSFACLWLRHNTFSPQRWALIGVCLSAFCGTGVTVIMSLSSTQSSEALLWLSGATYGVGYAEVYWLIPIFIVTVVLSLGPWRWLNLLQLGLNHTSALGLSNRFVLTALGSVVILLCALCVSVVGGISFVGLMAPHLVRSLGITNNRVLLPATALMGALLLILADYLAMQVMAPFELPSGLVVSATGGLYFVALLVSGKYARK